MTPEINYINDPDGTRKGYKKFKNYMLPLEIVNYIESQRADKLKLIKIFESGKEIKEEEIDTYYEHVLFTLKWLYKKKE